MKEYKKNIYCRFYVVALLLIFIALGVKHFIPQLLAYLVVAISLGLRHGLDADHIVVIDNVTRRLVNSNKSGSFTGMFFALGHSVVVFLLVLLTIGGVLHAHAFYTKLSVFGDKFGNFVSILFLSLTLLSNLMLAKYITKQNHSQVKPQNLMYKMVDKYVIQSIDSGYKMFIVGFLFGLGFDTATEVGLLALAAGSIFQGGNIYYTMLLPIAFACGMIVTDAVNSFFMSRVYLRVRNNLERLKIYNFLILGIASISTLIVILVEATEYLNVSVIQRSAFLNHLVVIGSNSETVGGVVAISLVCLGLFAYLHLMFKKSTTSNN